MTVNFEQNLRTAVFSTSKDASSRAKNLREFSLASALFNVVVKSVHGFHFEYETPEYICMRFRSRCSTFPFLLWIVLHTRGSFYHPRGCKGFCRFYREVTFAGEVTRDAGFFTQVTTRVPRMKFQMIRAFHWAFDSITILKEFFLVRSFSIHWQREIFTKVYTVLKFQYWNRYIILPKLL